MKREHAKSRHSSAWPRRRRFRLALRLYMLSVALQRFVHLQLCLAIVPYHAGTQKRNTSYLKEFGAPRWAQWTGQRAIDVT